MGYREERNISEIHIRERPDLGTDQRQRLERRWSGW